MENWTFTISMHNVYFCLLFIAAVWGLVRIYKEWKKPSADLKRLVEEHDEWLRKDLKRMERIDDGLDLLLECLYTLLDHEITGNGVDKIRILKENVHKYLVKRGRDQS